MYCSALDLHEHLQLNKDRHAYTKAKLQSGLDVFAYIELHSHCVWFHKQQTSGYNLKWLHLNSQNSTFEFIRYIVSIYWSTYNKLYF